MASLRAAVVFKPPIRTEAAMADLIFLALGAGLFAAFAGFAKALRRV